MAESALRQYEYGGEGLFGAFMPSRREIISPEAQIPMGYRQGRRGPEVILENIPAQYGEPETGFEYTPVVRGIRSALNAIQGFFSEPETAIEAGQSALQGVNQYMRDQYTAGALGGTTYNPQTGQVTEFNPIDAATMLAPSGFLTRAAATPGSTVLGMIGSKNARFTPEQLEAIKQLKARGWDTDQLFLHGTSGDYDDAFKASSVGDLGPGFYTTGAVFDDAGNINSVMSRSGEMETVPDIARRYANIRRFMRPEQRGTGAPNTRPLIYKKDLNFLDIEGGMVGPVDAERVNALKAQGYDGIRVIDPNTGNVAQTNVFDPENVRSAFDYSIPDTPAQGGSALRTVVLVDDGAGTAKILSNGNDVGEISYSLTGGNVQIKRADVTEPRQGIGTEAYKQFIDSKLSQGYTVGSDNIVSEAAQGVYRKLGEQGYDISQNPENRRLAGNKLTSLSKEEFNSQRSAMPTIYREGARVTAPGQVFEGPPVYTVSRSALNDLDMSSGARMQRAADQGFGETVYHGTGADINNFDPSAYGGSVTNARSARMGVWLTDNPEVAGTYARYAAEDVPVARLLKQSDEAGRRRDFDLQEKLMRDAEELELSGELINAGGQNIIPAKVRGNLKEIDAEGATLSDLDESQLFEWAQEAKREGFDGLKIAQFSDNADYGTYMPATHYLIFDPKNIRSVNAKYDPRAKGSSDILAGIAGAGVVGGSALSGQKQEQKQ